MLRHTSGLFLCLSPEPLATYGVLGSPASPARVPCSPLLAGSGSTSLALEPSQSVAVSVTVCFRRWFSRVGPAALCLRGHDDDDDDYDDDDLI